MRLLVTGPRTWGVIPQGVSDVSSAAAKAREESSLLLAALDEIGPSVVIHGAAAGADTWAGLWATAKGVRQHSSPAPFAYLGPVAGTMRNTYMLTTHRPDLVLACGEGTPGTENCVKQALLLGVPVRRIKT